MSKAQRDIQRKLRVFNHAKRIGNIRKTCRYFGVPRSLYYVWKASYEQFGEAGLINTSQNTTSKTLKHALLSRTW